MPSIWDNPNSMTPQLFGPGMSHTPAFGLSGYVPSGMFAPNLTAATPSSYDPRYGGIPQVPNPAATAASAVGANQANWPSMQDLFNQVNEYLANAGKRQLEINIPNYNALINQRSDLAGQYMSGMIPQDVVDQLIQRGAERGITTGLTPGSPATNAALMKAFYDTSTANVMRGTNILSGAISQAPVTAPPDPTRMFVTPDQIQNAQMAANLYASAPVPSAAAMNALPGRMPSYGGVVGARAGGYGAQTPINWAEPGIVVGSATGPFYEPWNQPYVHDPASLMTTGGWGVSPGITDWSNYGPQIGQDFGYNPQSWPDYATYDWGSNLDDFGVDWDSFYAGEEDFGYYDPIIDVSQAPGSGFYDWEGGY